jgi:hypothetical protein
MAWALTLDGSARSLSLNTPFYLPTNCDLEIDMAWNAISSSYEMIFGTWGTGVSDDQFYFGKYNAPNGTYTLYKRGSAVRENSSTGEIVVGTYAVLTLKRRGDNLSVLKDGVEICAPITFSAGVLSNAPIKVFCGGNESGFQSDVSVKSATLKNIDTATTTNLWDATASDHSNTGVQPELLDTVGGNNATGVGFPTDGSAWVDLGGGITPVDVGILSSQLKPEIDPVDIQQITAISVYSSEVTTSNDAIVIENITSISLDSSVISVTSDMVAIQSLSLVTIYDSMTTPELDFLSISVVATIGVSDSSTLVTADSISIVSSGNIEIYSSEINPKVDLLSIELINELLLFGLGVAPEIDLLSINNIGSISIGNSSVAPIIDRITIDLYTELEILNSIAQVTSDSIVIISKVMPFFGNNDLLLIDATISYALIDNTTDYRIK